jgi:hypothetical protein
MSSVFLAHSSADKRFVRRLAADLLERGIRVWFDEAELLVGDSLFAKIGDGVREVDYLAVILSPASVKSPWVQREVAAYGRKHGTEYRKWRACLIPCRLVFEKGNHPIPVTGGFLRQECQKLFSYDVTHP